MKHIIVYIAIITLIGCGNNRELSIYPEPIGDGFGSFCYVELIKDRGPKSYGNSYLVSKVNGKQLSEKRHVLVEFLGFDEPGTDLIEGWGCETIGSIGAGVPPPESGIERGPFCYIIRNKIELYTIKSE
jgi:hypothetical protein